MPFDIEVLWVDDDQNFLEMGSVLLERSNPQLNLQTETDPDKVFNRLRLNSFDCLVSDYEMPKMTGLELLERMRDEYRDLPFILFTGKGSEDVASRAVNLNVTGYHRKETGTDHFEMLANTIEKAVAGYRAQNLARHNEQKLIRYKQAIDYSSNLVAAINLDREFLFVNESYLEYRQRSRNEIVGESIDEILDPRTVDAIGPHIQTTFDGNREQFRFTNDYPHLGERHFNITYSPLTTQTGTIEGLIAEIQDITDLYKRGLLNE